MHPYLFFCAHYCECQVALCLIEVSSGTAAEVFGTEATVDDFQLCGELKFSFSCAYFLACWPHGGALLFVFVWAVQRELFKFYIFLPSCYQ